MGDYINKDFDNLAVHLTNVSVAREEMGLDKKIVTGTADEEFRIFLDELCLSIMEDYPDLVDKWLGKDVQSTEDGLILKKLIEYVTCRIEDNVVKCLKAAELYLCDSPHANEFTFLGVDTMLDV